MLSLLQDGEEFLANDPKKPKIDNGSEKIPEVDETPQTEAEA